MTIEELKNSYVWDSRYNLPLVPVHNNPWIYGAYFYELLEKPKSEMIQDFVEYYKLCSKSERLTRWPDGSGGKFSHDEIIGAAYILPEAAKSILIRLNERDGLYNEEDSQIESMFRFIFLVPYLRQCAGYFVSTFSQLMYCIHIIISCLSWSKKSGSSGVLMIWLMNTKMNDLPVCKIFIFMYNFIMKKKGCTIEWMLKEHFTELYKG